MEKGKLRSTQPEKDPCIVRLSRGPPFMRCGYCKASRWQGKEDGNGGRWATFPLMSSECHPGVSPCVFAFEEVCSYDSCLHSLAISKHRIVYRTTRTFKCIAKQNSCFLRLTLELPDRFKWRIPKLFFRNYWENNKYQCSRK